MKRVFLLLSLLMVLAVEMNGQSNSPINQMGNGDGFGNSQMGRNGRKGMGKDSLKNVKKEFPKGYRVWTVDKRFGDITPQHKDTVMYLFQNTNFTSGLYTQYNSIGNLGAPRINRIFLDRSDDDGDFLFTKPFDFFIQQPNQFLFVNTLSPLTNLTYYTCGNRTNGEDHFQAKFAVNVNRRLGFGFKVNYLYGRGYYSNQSTSLFNLSLFGSYIGDQYQAHLLFTTNHQKMAENGGITDDNYITHPETFDDTYATNEMPVMLEQNWNRNKHQHLFLTHRYNIGFHRKVKMTEEEIKAKKFAMESKKENEERERLKKNDDVDDEDDLNNDENENGSRLKYKNKNKPKTYAGRPDNAIIAGNDKDRNDTTKVAPAITIDKAKADSIMNAEKKAREDSMWYKSEYVPVTSFIHTAQLDLHDRIYEAYDTPDNYYANSYYSKAAMASDTIFDKTKYFRLRNTFALSLLEGFNKWAVFGIKAFVASDLRRYSLPDTMNILQGVTNHNLSVGGQISRSKGRFLKYSAMGEVWLLGEDQGQVKIDGKIGINFPLLRDTMSFVARGFFHNEKPNYFLRHYHSRNYWWDDDLGKQTHTRIEGILTYQKTKTTLRFGFDALTKYTYLGTTYTSDTDNGRLYNRVVVHQSDDAITVITAAIGQKVRLGIFNWEAIATYQKSSSQAALPVPTINVYTNLYLKFRIAKVLYTELGADARFFTEYEAPDYVPGMGQFAVQDNETKTKIGNYPIVNAYANFCLKGTRFFIMYSHANAGTGNKNSFLTPHYPMNNAILRFGISWNFFN